MISGERLTLVVSGYYGMGNAGDEAILDGMLHALRRLDPAATFTVISGAPQETASRHGVAALARRDVVGIIRALMRSDGLISGGGGLLQDRTSSRPVPYYTGTMLLARLLRRPVFVYAQGIGPIDRFLQRRLAGFALGRAKYLSVRDERSRTLVRDLGISRPVQLVPDPALALPRPATRHARRDRPSRHRIAVSLRDWRGWRGWTPEIISALRRLATTFELVLIPLHLPEDQAIARRVAAAIPHARLLHADSHREIVAELAAVDLVIGMRLHALVFAAVAGRPFVALSYDPKVDAFAEELGQPVGADVNRRFAAGALAALVLAHAGADHRGYEARVDELRERAETPALEIVRRLRPERLPRLAAGVRRERRRR